MIDHKNQLTEFQIIVELALYLSTKWIQVAEFDHRNNKYFIASDSYTVYIPINNN